MKTKSLRTNISALKKKVWKEFSKYIRLRYARNGYVLCYTCGKIMNWKEAQAGHGLSGRGNTILFDEELVKPQCPRCNLFLGGNYDIFHKKLIEEYGLEWYNNKLRLKSKTKQFTLSELQKLYDKYRKLAQKYEQSQT